MTQPGPPSVPLFQASATTRVSAPPDDVWRLVSDLRRSGEWSSECLGGEWLSGDPGCVGAVFEGHNVRAEDVVAWAPVVRGAWRTYATVVESEPGRRFAWSMQAADGSLQTSVWTFVIRPDGDGCSLAHEFRMAEATEGIRSITADMDDPSRARFVREWQDKIAADLEVTVRRVAVATGAPAHDDSSSLIADGAY